VFTGIVEAVVEFSDREKGRYLFRSDEWVPDGPLGSSVAFDGTCLTVVDIHEGFIVCDVIDETLARTTLGTFRPGRRVNVEQAMLASGRLDGHVVQGHVDTTLRLVSVGDELVCEVPKQYANLVVEKGSIALNGVSLTVAGLEGDFLTVALIPETLTRTNLGAVQIGDYVNAEFDIMGKYLLRASLLAAGA